MIDVWSLVRFVHVVGAVVWLGGQLTISALVMPAAGLHGWANAVGRRTLARAFAVASLVGTFVVVLLATALPVS